MAKAWYIHRLTTFQYINLRTIERNSEMIILGVIVRLVGTLLHQKMLVILVQRCRKFQLDCAGITGAPTQLNAYILDLVR